jgi:hypothetical protein
LISQSLNRRLVRRPELSTLYLFDSLGNILKKHLYTGVLAVCLAAPAAAVTNKLSTKSPDEPVHRRAIVLCMAVCIGLRAYKHRMTKREQATAAYRR